jgi:uncharacterized protein YerC
MTQVSRQKLEKKVYDRVFDIFVNSFVYVKNRQRAEKFLTELFSPTERIMISKRLAIAYLLSKKYPFDSIKSLLHVSQSTVCKMNYYINKEKNGFLEILKEVEKNKKDNSIAYLLEMIEGLLPPVYGTNWSEENKKHYQRLRDLEEPF